MAFGVFRAETSSPPGRAASFFATVDKAQRSMFGALVVHRPAGHLRAHWRPARRAPAFHPSHWNSPWNFAVRSGISYVTIMRRRRADRAPCGGEKVSNVKGVRIDERQKR